MCAKLWGTMSTLSVNFKSTVAALLIGVGIFLPAAGLAEVGTERSDDLIRQLAEAPDADAARSLEREIELEWSKSGSVSMDFLLKRGRDALAVNDFGLAIDHLTALTDHAPDFAEGWHTLAMAYFNADMVGPTMYALERTLALNPDHFGALRGLGAVFDQIGDPARAYDAYDKALSIRPFDKEVEEARDRLAAHSRGTTL